MKGSPWNRTIGRLAAALLVAAGLAVGIGQRAAAADEPSPGAPMTDVLLTAIRSGGDAGYYARLLVYTDGTATWTVRPIVGASEETREFVLEDIHLTEADRRLVGDDVGRLTLDLLMQRLERVQFPLKYCEPQCEPYNINFIVTYPGASRPIEREAPYGSSDPELWPVLGIIEVLSK